MADPTIKDFLVRIMADTEQMRRELDRAEKKVVKSAGLMDKAAKSVEKQFGGMGAAALRSALSFVSFTAIAGGATAAFSKMIKEAAGAEMATKRFDAQLKATNVSSGKTVNQLNALADKIKTTSLATEDEAKAAISQLLSFRSVAGDVFDDTLTLAQDLAAAGFGTLTENTSKLGKALEDPTAGFKALRSAGVILTDTQEALVKSLEKTGDRLGAQKAILDAVRDRVGGAGAAQRNTLTGAWHGLTEATNDWFEALGKNSGLVGTFTNLLNGMTGGLNRAAAAMASKKGELAHLEEFAGRFKGNADPRTLARIAQLREEIALEDQVEAIRAKSAQRLSELTKIEIASGEELSKKREAWAKAEQENRAELARFNRRADEQDARSAAQSLEEQGREARVFADEMINLRLELADRLDGEEFDVSIFQTPLPADVQKWIDDQERAAKEAADRIKAIQDEALRDQFDAWRDMFRDLMDGNVKSFEDAAKRMLGAWKDMAANMLAEKTFDKVFGGGGLLEKVLGKNGGLIVAGVTSAIGLLSGILGPRPSDRTEGINFDLTTGWRQDRDLGPSKDSPENRAAANALFDAVNKFRAALTSFGLNPAGGAGTINVGAGNSRAPFEVAFGGSGMRGFSTADEAFKFFADEIVANLAEVPERLQTLVDGFDGSNVEAFFAEIERFGNFEATLQGVRDQILQITDPQAFDFAMLEREFGALREEAAALGFDLVDIERLYGLKRAEIVAKYASDVTDGFDVVIDHLDPFADTIAELRDELARAADPQAFELRELDEWYAEVIAKARGNAKDLEIIEDVYGQRRAEIVARYAQEGIQAAAEAAAAAVAAAEAAARELASAAEESWARVEALARRNLDLQLETLATERDAIEETRGAAQSLLDSIRGARLRFLTDPRLFRGSRGEQLNALLAKLDATAAAAAGGDRQAQSELAEIALAAADANQAFNASSEAGARIQEHIAGILDSAESVAAAQLRVAEDTLKANQDQVALLQAQLDALGGMGPNAALPPDASDFAALNKAFVDTRNTSLWNGGTDQGFVNSPAYRAFEQELFGMIAATNDVGFLLSDLANARSQAGAGDPYAASSGRRVGEVQARLRQIGVQGFAAGGMTGDIARIHNGELLYTGPPARVFNARESGALLGGMNGGGIARTMEALREDVRTLTRVMSLVGEDQAEGLGRVAGRLDRISGDLSVAIARR